MTNNYDMTANELETLLTERVNTFDLKKEAFDMLKRSKKFLKMMSAYLIENNLITEELKIKLTENIKND